jgi:poly(A) polymerase/tRNA nucleotidyltransferase (CCA-adding enzyme)
MLVDLPNLLNNLSVFVRSRGVSAWLVGGAARDLVAGRAPHDLDLAVDADGCALARAFADTVSGAFVALDEARDTGRVVLPGPPPVTIDFARLRGPTLEDDLHLRDFTVNALALPIQAGSLALAPIDPTGGLADLQAQILRPCSPQSLADDPLRALRVPRFCATLGLAPVPELAGQIRAVAPQLAHVAAERIRDELLRLLDAPAAAPWLRYLDAANALTTIFPELEPSRLCDQPRVHFLPVLAHVLEAVACLEWIVAGVGKPAAVRAYPHVRRTLPYAERFTALLAEPRSGGHRRLALLKLAVLLHDNAKPQTKVRQPDGSVTFYGHQEIGADVAAQIGKRLRLSRHDIGYVALVVRQHMRPGQLRTAEVLTARAVSRFFRDTTDAGPDVLLHELADHLATRGPNLSVDGWNAHLAWVEALLDAYWGVPEPQPQPPLLNGHDLMTEFGLPPGPRLGELLRELAEAQAAREIGTRAEALTLAARLIAAYTEE